MNGNTNHLPTHLRQTKHFANAHHIPAMLPASNAMQVLLKRLGSILIGSHLLDQEWQRLCSMAIPATEACRHLLPGHPPISLQLQHLRLLLRYLSTPSQCYRLLHPNQMALRKSVPAELTATHATQV
jgi:hypothetical protein